MEFIQSKWNLDDLYPEDNGSALQADVELLKQKANEFESYRPELKPELSRERFLEILSDYKTINELAHKLSGYTQLQVSADTQDSALVP